jgi:hypothetical protein
MTPVYVFGLTERTPPPLIVTGHHIEFIGVAGVQAAIERCRERPSLSEAALRSQHEIVMRIFEDADDLLPVRFGAWVEEHELSDLLTPRRAAIKRALDLVRGRVQMTVRFAEAAPTGAVAYLSDRASGTAYLQARRAATRALPAEAAHISAAARDVVVAELTSPSSPRAAACLYHLIDRENVALYRATIARFESPEVAVSGPWPAFAFASDTWP